MANPLTGENEAVVQVSESTINRLMATLHQNAGTKKDLPSHPHNMSVHITKNESVDGVFGWLVAQLGVPQIHLFHRATDRFELELNVRARFFPEEESAHLPEFIHGVVRATYKIHPIDENCRGWQTRADKFLWVRVVKNTVRFTGTAVDEIVLVNDPGVDRRIEHLIADLLDNRFEAAPQKVGKEFRSGQLISLKSRGGDAIAVPINLPGGGVSDDPASIQQVFLDGHDFAIAIGVDYLRTKIEPLEEQVLQSVEFKRTFTLSLDIEIGPIDIEEELVEVTVRFRIRVTSANFWWEDGGIRFDLAGDFRDLSHDMYLADFTVKGRIDVEFDAANEVIRFVHYGSPSVHVNKGFILTFMPDGIVQRIADAVSGYLGDLPTISVSTYKEKLRKQLTRLDDKANVRFDTADFRSDGIVLMGTVEVAKRAKAVVAFKESDGEPSFSAFSSWAPGGWIERFVWTWRPDFMPNDSRTIRDRYVITSRPAIMSRWGKHVIAEQDALLPGLHGSGQVCLEIRGVQVDRRTGRLKKFTKKTCRHFGLLLPFAPGGADDRLFVKLKADDPGELDKGVIELGGARVDRDAANTLVVYSGGGFDRETARTLTSGLEASTREDAGLRILYLVSEDASVRDAELGRTVAAFSDEMGAHIDVVEDVAQSWTRQFGIEQGSTAWRLITPNGGFTWEHDGRLFGDQLGEVLDDHLRASPPPNYQSVGVMLTPATPAPHLSLGRQPARRRRNCPRVLSTPPTSIVTFVRGDSAASERQLAELARVLPTDRDESLGLIAVVDGDDELADAMSDRFSDIEIIADPAGVLAERFGVRIWPTAVGIAQGLITGVREGLFEIAPTSVPGDDDTDDDDTDDDDTDDDDTDDDDTDDHDDDPKGSEAS